MFSKLKFNNLIISNKTKIKQARVQTINKLVHKLRKQQQLLSKYPENAKIKERLRKANECIEELKKLKSADIMRHTLVLGKNPTAIITNERATPGEIAVAMLAMNKVLQNLLKHFKEVLQLNESDETWRRLIMEKSKRREKIERTELKKRKRMELKEQRSMERKRRDWLEENAITDTPANETAVTQSDGEEVQLKIAGKWQVEEINDGFVEEKAKVKENNKAQSKKQQSLQQSQTTTVKDAQSKKQESLQQSNTTAIAENTHTQTVKQKEKFNKPAAAAESNEQVILPEQTNDSADAKKLKKVAAKERKKPAYVAPIQEVQQVVDPFFITETGDNYVATVAVIQPTEADEANNEVDNYQKPMNRRQHRENERNTFKKATTRDFESKHNHDMTQNYSRNQHNNKNTNEEELDEQLHPSWLAKKKQKPIILNNMQNKKIKFDDEGGNAGKDLATSWEQQEWDEQLHPSWLAKKKQKPIILNNMSNKKIKFDDDGGNAGKDLATSWVQQEQFKHISAVTTKTNEAAADLHPSWAAKQKLKPVIQAFQGKKITFDAD